MARERMTNALPQPPRRALSPVGTPLRIENLPAPDTKRWVIRRKAEVVSAVRAGLISLEEACERYTLTNEEFLSWQRLIENHGMRGLRATRIQYYRQAEKPTEG